MRRVGIVGADIGLGDWQIGLLHIDDSTGKHVASLDSVSLHWQIEIRGTSYRALLAQARHVAGLHVGFVSGDCGYPECRSHIRP